MHQLYIVRLDNVKTYAEKKYEGLRNPCDIMVYIKELLEDPGCD